MTSKRRATTRTKAQRQAWWHSLTPDQQQAYVAKKEDQKRAARGGTPSLTLEAARTRFAAWMEANPRDFDDSDPPWEEDGQTSSLGFRGPRDGYAFPPVYTAEAGTSLSRPLRGRQIEVAGRLQVYPPR